MPGDAPRADPEPRLRFNLEPQDSITRCVIISQGRQAGSSSPSHSKQMENEKAKRPDDPAAEIVAEVLDAVSHRSWEQLDALADPDIELLVTGRDDVASSPNEHVWRSIRVHGAEELHSYLGDLYEALPSLTLVARRRRDIGTCADVSTEFSGVNNNGVPFDAFAEITFCVVGGKLVRVTAEVVRVSFGAALLMDPDQDPRRYFEGFLGADNGLDPASS
jgi:ketosteroid isomerase-like protein